MKNKYLLILFTLITKLNIYADSPLTSIVFYNTYKEVSIIQRVKSDGFLNDNYCIFLSSPSVSNGEKAAFINALGWSFGCKNNALTYEKFLIQKYKSKKETVDFNKITATEMMCLGYLKAMDNYAHPNDALAILEKAIAKDSKSQTIRLIHALVKGQISMETNWCEVWKSYENVLNMSDSLNKDIKPEALKQFDDYLSLYKSSCL
jgi:hypothetical protein